jgi:hypothetical protein
MRYTVLRKQGGTARLVCCVLDACYEVGNRLEGRAAILGTFPIKRIQESRNAVKYSAD